MAAILNFPIFFQNAKHKYACISKTVLDRAILTKFDPQGNSGEQMIQFSKMFCPAKNGGYFRIFRKNPKTQKCLYLESHAIVAKFLTHRVSVKTTPFQFSTNIFHSRKMAAVLHFPIYFYPIFPPKFTLPKYGGHCQFSNLWQKVQNTKLPLSP